MLIIGAGDIARRLIPHLRDRYAVAALVRNPARAPALIGLGARPLLGDLDTPASLAALPAIADAIIHLAPPQDGGETDQRTRNLIHALNQGAMLAQPAERSMPARLVYASTTGVYGDCAGRWVDESTPLAPRNARARRRADAEAQLRGWGGQSAVAVSILRVPGIYAADRLPLERIRAGTPVLRAEDDVYTNHIHAEDLARIVVRALECAPADAIYNANDDSELRMGEYFDLVADAFALPRPPRVAREEATRCIAPMLLSFMSESRRLSNARMKAELGVRLCFPTVREGLEDARRVAGAGAAGADR